MTRSNELTPRQIVEALDRHIIGQDDAKRAVAIAIRNRWRRQQLTDKLREEVGPKNIILIGATGVGKTEIARRLAKLVNAPWVKVEATKFTEVGYHGRDVESIVRDLLENAIHMVRTEQTEVVRIKAELQTEEQLLDALLPPSAADRSTSGSEADAEAAEKRRRNREKLRAQLQRGELEESTVDLVVQQKALPVGMLATIGGGGGDAMEGDIQNLIERLVPSQSKPRRVSVAEARKIIFDEQCERLIDREKVTEIAINRTENSGIVFIDEIDKVAGGSSMGPDVSRQGVQRDLLPIVEGSTVNTRYGPVKTQHILFIAAGAFHISSVSDLMPELQGRFPIHVELTDLTKEDFVRILTEPEAAVIKQQIALMNAEGVLVDFQPEAIEAMADIAIRLNKSAQNIGARRLYTITERLMEDLSFEAPERKGDAVSIDAAMVHERLDPMLRRADQGRFGFHSVRD